MGERFRFFVCSVAIGALSLGLGVGCDPDETTVDAGPMVDAGPPVPASIDHCDYEMAPATARSGETVTSGALSAGTAEAFLDLPLGAAMGSYTGRAESFGRSGFVPSPDERRTPLANSFAPSVGIETIPRIRALALSSGGETVVIMKVDLSLSYQGLLHDVEAALGPEYSGKVIMATSHSHSSFGNYTGHSAMKVGFSEFRGRVYQELVSQLVSVAQGAIADLEPAQIGIALNDMFDLDNRVNRDRRSENDMLAGGSCESTNCIDDGDCESYQDCRGGSRGIECVIHTDCERDEACFDGACTGGRCELTDGRPIWCNGDVQMFMIRVDNLAGEPMAMLPIFGMHGTIHGENNALISTDSVGGLERVLEESFDSDVLVMHLQGAGGDVSPAGMGATDCSDTEICADFGRPESIGHFALPEVRALYDTAGASMETDLEIEMLTRTVPLGPNWETFTIRDGTVEYAPWDGRTWSDGEVYDSAGQLISPVDEFNAPFGAALCGSGDDFGLRLRRAQLPGFDQLADYTYFNCLRIDQISNVLGTLFDIELEETPLCETTRTTVSALRLGDWMIGTLPGEPVTLLRDHLQSLSPMAPERTIVVGYAQDHGGYLMRPEDWLSGGYEPSITFWGPLAAEYVTEQVATLMEMAATPEREDANLEGAPHPVVPEGADEIVLDVTTDVGTVPTMMPEYLLAHRFQTMTDVQPAATVERLQNVFFTWIGDDPLRGTARITIQREVSPDTWEDLTRRSGRIVHDGAILMTWTPNPIFRETGVPRQHYYTVEFQAAAPMGTAGLEAIGDRRGLPLGTYRFSVVHPDYALTSDSFEVVAATFDAAVEMSGSDATVTLTTENANGYRLLDMGGARSNHAVPVRSAAVEVTVMPAGRMESLSTDENGAVTITDVAGSTVTITDAFGNTVTITP